MPLPESFHPAVRLWFDRTFPGGPTRAQLEGWPAIQRGDNVLIEAPTGSGKTLAAFLAGIDSLVREAERGELGDRLAILYVSPLKALNNDVKKNLEEPLAGIHACAKELGLALPELRTAVRTGDTPQSERQAIVRRPPHVLITTPESLYLLLTSEQGRAAIATARTVIVDEVHAVVGNKRGAHLALSLERLEGLAKAPPQRIGLSATVSPIDEVAHFLVGAERPAPTIVAAGRGRPIDLEILLPSPALSAVAGLKVWDSIYDRVAELAREHRTTIVFLKSRRWVERTGLELKKRLGKKLVGTHHGSLSLKSRQRVERRLKRGELKVVVATGSLELGIDVGSIDLVVQVEAPGSIATLLQRVGRSGHAVGATSKGRIIPITLDDLVESAAVVKAVREGRLDRTHVPRGGFDVLAQQLTAEVAARGETTEKELLAIARGAWPYRHVTAADVEKVLALHSERPRGAPRGSLALVHRDRPREIVRARRATRMVAIGGGGAIPDRANYDVIIEESQKRIGDLDEDFSFESSAGDVFVLGSHAWQITKIRTGKVFVRDAKGKHPTIPFWRGDAPGRTYDLSIDTAGLRREIGARCSDDLRADLEADLRATCGLDDRGARLLVDYVAAGKAALGLVPDEKTLVCERFFDNTGGTQLVLHAPFGMRVNKAWGLALRKRFCKTFDFELQAAATDEAILLSVGPRQSLPPGELAPLVRSRDARDTLEQAFLTSPFFETLFRWTAVRSLAVPRQMGGRRTAPQILRLRAGDLLANAFPEQAACQEVRPKRVEIPDHPIVTETLREACEDLYDVDSLEKVLARLEAGEITIVPRESPAPSPFAHEILAAWGYAFLDDAPAEERRARAVTTHRTLLAQVLASGGLAQLLDRDLAEEIAAEIGRTKEGSRARDPRDLLVILDEAGALPLPELLRSCDDPALGRAWIDELIARGDVVRRAARGEERLLASSFEETFAKAYADDGAERDELVRRFLSRHAPLTAAEVAAGLRMDELEVRAALARLELAGELVRGTFTRSTEEVAWRPLVERLHVRTLEKLRKRARPVSRRDFARFLVRWQRADKPRLGADGLARVIGQLEGWELPASEWESMVLPARVRGEVPALLDSLGFSGEVVWGRVSSATKGANDVEEGLLRGPGKIALVLREDLPWLRAVRKSETSVEESLTPEAQAALAHLRARGASFVADLARGAKLGEGETLAAVAELVRAGLATGDGFALLRALLDPRGRRRARKQLRAERERGLGTRAASRIPGRIALLEPPEATDDEDELAERRAQKLLERWGLVCKEVLEHEPLVRPGEIFAALRRLEARGLIRRGLFALGLSGEQYALPLAVDRLRSVRRKKAPEEPSEPIALAACDPLAAFVATLDERAPRVTRVPGNRIVLLRGEVVAVREAGEVRILAAMGEATSRKVSALLGEGALSVVV